MAKPALALLLLLSATARAAPAEREAAEKKIAEIERARALGTAGDSEDRLAAALGDLLARVGRYGRAVEEYDRAIAHLRALHRAAHGGGDQIVGELSRLYGNSAESAMARGDLAGAIDRYRLALTYQMPSALLASLPHWGLAVALDRDGQHALARAAARRAVDLDPRLGVFDDPSVYFVPEGDVWYYRALAHRQQGNPVAARAAFRRYLEARPGSPWQARVAQHLAEIGEPEPGAGRLAVSVPGRERDAATLRPVIAASLDALDLCLGRDDRREADLLLDVARDGSVRRAAPAGDGPPLPPCLESLAESWRFPPLAAGRLRLRLQLADGPP